MNKFHEKLDDIYYMQEATNMLFVELMLYIPVNSISDMLDCFPGLTQYHYSIEFKMSCSTQGHNTAPMVGFETASSWQ